MFLPIRQFYQLYFSIKSYKNQKKPLDFEYFITVPKVVVKQRLYFLKRGSHYHLFSAFSASTFTAPT